MIKNLNDLSDEERLWLNLLSTYFNIHYNKSPKYKEIHSFLLPLFPKCGNELWCLITNMARGLKHRANGMRIPRDFFPYKKNKQGLQHAKMLTVLDTLESNGYLDYFRGGLLNMNKDSAQTSIYVPTNKFLVLWKGIDVSKEKSYVSAIQIRDRLLKESLSTKGHAGVGAMQEFVTKYNELLANTRISVSGVELPVQQYSRIFSDNTSRGGRYYNSSGGVQTMPSLLRKRITINGESTAELDFKALHPNILYEYAEKELGVQIPMEDPYAIDCSDLFEVDCYIVKDGHNPLRSLIKQVVLRGLNAKNLESVIPTLTNNWYEECAREEDGEYYGLILKTKDNKFPAKALCQRVAEKHSVIKDAFFSDVGLLLQKVDSDIMTIVLQKFTDIGVCALSEHDSVIVPDKYADLASAQMLYAYNSVVGSANHCKIERKQ